MTHQLEPSFWKALKFRCIGPSRGGRVIAVAGHPTEKATFYFGAVAGGLWKTVDAGTTWVNISDGYFKSSSVSDIAVSPSDPNVIYVGMGESTIRTDVTYGDGVYKSVDGGKTWRHWGLADTRHIGKVRIHPRNPDRVYVAALGHAFGPNQERGVFRSKDGGASWEKVLFVSDKAGAVDLTFDPLNPDVLYAAIWQVYRNFWELNSGGPDSGLWKSTERRRRLCQLHRRRLVQHHLQPADGPVLPHRYRQRLPLSRLRHPTGQFQRARASGHNQRRHRLGRLRHRGDGRKRLHPPICRRSSRQSNASSPRFQMRTRGSTGCAKCALGWNSGRSGWPIMRR